jgi:exosortase/archaeosortase family protein
MFYILALAPFVLLAYFYFNWPFSLVIPLYSFILLIIKKDKLFSQKEPSPVQRPLGLLTMVASFFVHYLVAPMFPTAAFFGGANYAVYIIGLFLLFFDVHVLKEAFSPLFLIVGTISISVVSNMVEPFFTPYLPSVTSFFVGVMRTIGMRVTTIASSNLLVLHTLQGGELTVEFVWGCVGFDSLFIFSILLIVILAEEPASLETKTLWSLIGIVGTIILNIIRVVMIFLTDYFYGYEVGGWVHYVIGYVLFIAWITIFVYTFSKRQIISQRLKLLKTNN